MQIHLKLIFAIASGSLLVGCDQPKIDHSKIRESGFVYCGQGEPDTFNPQLVDSGVTVDALAPQIFDTLLTLDNEQNTPQPSLAKSWSVSRDGLTYRFELESHVHFQSTPYFSPTRSLNAQDVLFTFNRLLDPEHPYHKVNGHYPWFSAVGFNRLIDKIQMINDTSIEFILSRPDNSFLSLLATPYSSIHSAEYANQLAAEDNKSQLDSQPIGTGPFYLDQFKDGDFVRLKRHPDYWRGAAKMEQVVFDIAQRGTGTLAKLLLNECDVLYSPISSQIPIIEQQAHVTLRSTPAMNVAYLALNTGKKALNDTRVRRAISFAIDRQNIIDSVYYGRGSVAYNLLPPISWAYFKNTSQVRYDQQYAKGLLRDAGYQSGLELTMAVPAQSTAYNPSPRKTAELIQSYLADIGISLTLAYEEHLREFSTLDSNIDIYLTGISGQSADPDRFLRPALACRTNSQVENLTHWCNDDFDSLLDLALITDQQRFRANLYKQAQNLINQQAPVIPIAHGTQFKAYNNSLIGFSVSPFHVQPFNQVERLK